MIHVHAFIKVINNAIRFLDSVYSHTSIHVCVYVAMLNKVIFYMLANTVFIYKNLI